MEIERIDHFVLTVRDVEATCAFYHLVLGMEVITFGEGRTALAFGRQKINLHRVGQRIEPQVAHPTPGTGDFCLITRTPLPQVIAHIQACGVPVELGPVPRTGAHGPMQSVYIRDPDGNLVEIAAYAESAGA
jgi:catechol 2,3-dioxygenase-like lactoylglutathione lyase family enzyme